MANEKVTIEVSQAALDGLMAFVSEMQASMGAEPLAQAGGDNAAAMAEEEIPEDTMLKMLQEESSRYS